jgi:hypothetical protein
VAEAILTYAADCNVRLEQSAAGVGLCLGGGLAVSGSESVADLHDGSGRGVPSPGSWPGDRGGGAGVFAYNFLFTDPRFTVQMSQKGVF